ncbi:MAG TPA: hypothetical protein VMV97_03925 [Sulfuriferula sp.]|nr:hypothetical protein [Sulfuriferula sp.]
MKATKVMLIYILAVSLITFLVSLLFAGMKGREEAKVKWTWSLLIAFTVYTIVVTNMSHSDDGRILVGGMLILVGVIVGYVLNQVGRWCIDFIAIKVMSDNRERAAKGYEPPLN